MDDILKQKIIDKLIKYLNRAPSDAEVINGQTDSTLMQWIAQDDAQATNMKLEALQTDTAVLKASAIINT